MRKIYILLIIALFIALSAIVFYIDKENSGYPILALVSIAWYAISVFVRRENIKNKKYLPVGKNPFSRMELIIAVIVSSLFIVPGIIWESKTSWNGIGHTIFFGLMYLFASLRPTRDYLFRIDAGYVLFIDLVYREKWRYSDILSINITKTEISFQRKDGVEKRLEIEIDDNLKNEIRKFIPVVDVVIV